MPRVSLIAIGVSVLLVMTLWLFAESLRQAPPPVSVPTPAPQVVPAPTAPVNRPTAGSEETLSCATVESRLIEQLAASRSCTRNADCTIVDYGYPVECLTAVARAQISELRQAFFAYRERCEYRVYYDCPTGDARPYAVCDAGRCEVRLLLPDRLSDDTLDYLEQDD